MPEQSATRRVIRDLFSLPSSPHVVSWALRKIPRVTKLTAGRQGLTALSLSPTLTRGVTTMYYTEMLSFLVLAIVGSCVMVYVCGMIYGALIRLNWFLQQSGRGFWIGVLVIMIAIEVIGGLVYR
jgi:hypothetical protein